MCFDLGCGERYAINNTGHMRNGLTVAIGEISAEGLIQSLDIDVMSKEELRQC